MQTSFSELEYSGKKKMTRRDRFLGEIDGVTPWSAIVAEIQPFYPKGEGRGRPPIGLERMLRMYIAQQCFGLSDEGIEDAIYDSQAIRRFVGIDLSHESAPDATTVLKFRRLLETNKLTERIFAAINTLLATKGFTEGIVGILLDNDLEKQPLTDSDHTLSGAVLVNSISLAIPRSVLSQVRNLL